MKKNKNKTKQKNERGKPARIVNVAAFGIPRNEKVLTGLEIATNTVAFATEFLFLRYHSPFSAVSFNTSIVGSYFVFFATPLTTQWSATILRLNFVKLRLNFRILSQNCDWIFSLISSPGLILHAQSAICVLT